MAKQIERTPSLWGKDEIRLILNMIKEETAPDPKRIAMLRKARKMKFEVIYH